MIIQKTAKGFGSSWNQIHNAHEMFTFGTNLGWGEGDFCRTTGWRGGATSSLAPGWMGGATSGLAPL